MGALGTAPVATDRRGFLVLAGAGLGLALIPAPCSAADATDIADAAAGLSQTFVRIAPDDTVTVICKHLDMGQGIWTGLATIVAEEIDARWDQIRVEAAPARLPDYGHTRFRVQTTGGSTSIANSWQQLRLAGATARAMLIAAAARRWGVAPGAVVARDGRLTGPSGDSATYGEMAAAAAREAVPPAEGVALKPPDAFRLIGRPLPRLDSADKTFGRTAFGIDIVRPGMKIAVVARPPRFGAKVARFDASAALRSRGVVAVVAVPSGVAVIADSTWQAIKGRAALAVEWDESGVETRSSEALLAEYRRIADAGSGIAADEKGDPAAALAGAEAIVEAEFTFPFLAHAPMEPLTAVIELRDGGCEIWAGIQSQTGNQKAAADILGLPIERVQLHTLQAGGSFGRRAAATNDWIAEAAEVAKASGGRWPIKLMWTREDDIRGGYYRPMTLHRVRAGLDAEGRIVAVDQRIVSQSLLFSAPYGDGEMTRLDFTATEGNIAQRYDIPNTRTTWTSPKVRVPVYLFRSVGNTHTSHAKEVLMDALARRAGRDRVAFRLAHLGTDERSAAVLRLAAEKAGWGRRMARGRGRGVALQLAFGTRVAQVAEVTIGRDGAIRVDRVVCAVDCGIAINPDTIRAQIEGGIGFGLGVALHGAITLDGGVPVQGNFDEYRILRVDEMPDVEVHIVASAEPPSGIGEPGATPIAPAVANAIADASGVVIQSLPLPARIGIVPRVGEFDSFSC